MYQALYRKWRPRTFDDVVGQGEVTETLKNQLISGRLSHAYLFVGTRGTGKTTCAKILARAVNCETPKDGSPCNKCKSCLGIEDGSIMDVVELDAASNNGVDNVRALRDEAVYSPASVKKRVYIIDEVHMLTNPAFNALLKILEEPPEHLMFILATTELVKMPATILSRCQRYRFKRLEIDVISKRIKYVAKMENIELEAEAAELLAELADGSMRDGLSLLDQSSVNRPITAENVRQTIGLAEKQGTADLLSAIADGETEKAVLLLEGFWQEGNSAGAILSELCALLRNILILKVAPKGGRELITSGYTPGSLKVFASRMPDNDVLTAINSIMDTIAHLRDGRDPKTAAEICIISLCDPDLGDDISSLRRRVEKLEATLSSGKPLITKKSDSPVEPFKTEIFDDSTIDDEPPFDMELDTNAIKQDIISECDSNKEELPSVAEHVSPSQKVSASGDGGLWDRLYTELMNTMPVFQRVNLSGAIAEVRGGTLVIEVDGVFKKNELEKSEAQEYIRNVIIKISGEAMPFKIKERAFENVPNADKLGELSENFPNITVVEK